MPDPKIHIECFYELGGNLFAEALCGNRSFKDKVETTKFTDIYSRCYLRDLSGPGAVPAVGDWKGEGATQQPWEAVREIARVFGLTDCSWFDEPCL